MDALPMTPSRVALMMAEPSASPMTSPLSETVATPGWVELQVTGRSS